MESIDKTFDVDSDFFGLVRCSQGIVHEEFPMRYGMSLMKPMLFSATQAAFGSAFT